MVRLAGKGQLDRQEFRELRDLLDSGDVMAKGDLQGHLVCQDLRVLKALLEQMEALASRVNLDLQVPLVIGDHLVYLVLLVLLDQEEQWVLKERGEIKENRARRVQLVLKVLLGRLVVLDQEVSVEKKDLVANLVLLELRDALEIKDLLEWQDLWDHPVAQVFLDLLVKLGLLDLLDPEESEEREDHLELLDLLE